MMNDLDDKILSILRRYKDWKGSQPIETVQLALIKLAFQNAGYVKVEDDIEIKDNVIRIRDLHLMTGRSWYEQFRRELDKYNRVELDTRAGPADFIHLDTVMEAAQRAAGINGTKEQQ